MPYKDPEKQREADRRWREANLEKARARKAAYRAANRMAKKSLHGRLQGLSKGR
jgi:hypothetical protein